MGLYGRLTEYHYFDSIAAAACRFTREDMQFCSLRLGHMSVECMMHEPSALSDNRMVKEAVAAVLVA